MADTVRLYISAAPHLHLEREVLSRATTEVPTTLAWRIVQTPAPGEPADLEAAANADLHILVMSDDIQAPVGAEWHAAWRAGRTSVLFLRKNVPRTPAGMAFVREMERRALWRLYEDAADLRRQVLDLLVEHILTSAAYYELSAAEAERLSEWQAQLRAATRQVVDPTIGGAGASSVVLSVERYVPSEGQLVEPPAPANDAQS
jgi:hypothetical protein